MSYENSRRPSSLLMWISGFVAGACLSGVVHSATDNTDARIKEVQIQNEQLDRQLSGARTVGNLVLKDSDHTFTFRTTAQDGRPETCKGSYDVQNNIARVASQLACTETVAVTQG